MPATMVNTRASSSRAGSAAPETPTAATPSKRTNGHSSSSSSNGHSSRPKAIFAWSHSPDAPTLLWLAISLPLVVWDTIYVLGRPHTMENGWLHWPLWSPYKLYGEVDHVYGWKAFHAKSGFTSAQGALNAIETVMYFFYIWAFLTKAVDVAGGKKAVTGRCGAQAVLIGFSAAVMTLSKTVLYWLNEYYSGFDNIGHNDIISLIFLWIIPNGAWLVGSTWMIYSLGADILQGIETASVRNKDE